MVNYVLKQSGKTIKTPEPITTHKQARICAMRYNKDDSLIQVLTNKRTVTGKTVPVEVAYITFDFHNYGNDPFLRNFLGGAHWTKDGKTRVVLVNGDLGNVVRSRKTKRK